jgi:multidrug efflux pump subunit AcrB
MQVEEEVEMKMDQVEQVEQVVAELEEVEHQDLVQAQLQDQEQPIQAVVEEVVKTVLLIETLVPAVRES